MSREPPSTPPERNKQAEPSQDASKRTEVESAINREGQVRPPSARHTDIAGEAVGYTDNAPLGEGSGTRVPKDDKRKAGGVLDRIKSALGLGGHVESDERGSGADVSGAQSGTRSDPNASRNLGSDRGRSKSE